MKCNWNEYEEHTLKKPKQKKGGKPTCENGVRAYHTR